MWLNALRLRVITRSWPQEEFIDGVVPCASSLIVENACKAYTKVLKRSTISANALHDEAE